MKRPARVPASTAVRMNSASNRMAKWYQNAIIALPPMQRTRDLRHADGQRRRAAGARDDGRLADVLRRLRQLLGRDREAPVGDVCAALSGVVPITAAGLFMVK